MEEEKKEPPKCNLFDNLYENSFDDLKALSEDLEPYEKKVVTAKMNFSQGDIYDYETGGEESEEEEYGEEMNPEDMEG